MRVIKFRGKLLRDGEWIYGSLIAGTTDKGTEVAFIVPTLPMYRVDPATVGQFTGLKDRHGKEIYEGDVLNCYDDYPEPWVRVVRYSADLVEETPTPGFVLANVKGVSVIDTFDDYDEFEVIGNEFDNPELIKKGGEQ